MVYDAIWLNAVDIKPCEAVGIVVFAVNADLDSTSSLTESCSLARASPTNPPKVPGLSIVAKQGLQFCLVHIFTITSAGRA